MQCPNHAGAFDCSPFCPLCEGNQEATNKAEGNGEKGKEKMKITDWDNTPLPHIEKLFELVSETFEDIDEDEALRLALYVWNCEPATTPPTPEGLEALRSDENDTFMGDQRDEADFAEYWFTEVDTQMVSPNLVIDWAGTYKYALSHDFYTYGIFTKTEAEPFSLKRFFWRNY